MDCSSAIKKNGIMPFAATWIDQEIVIVSEASQRKPSEVAALFTIAKTWRQSTCPSTDECINKMCMYNGILLSHKKE